jgi:valyl-tRNA synthetase
MHYCFSPAIRLLHPMMPFVTEELWHSMGYAASCETIMRASWPQALSDELMASAEITAEVVEYVDAKHDMVRIGRQMRADYGIAPGKRIDYMIKPNSTEAAEMLIADKAAVRAALRADNIRVDAELQPQAMPSAISPLGTVYLPVEDVIDVEAELKRLNDELAKINGYLVNATRKLENQSFVSKAPADVVEKAKATRDGLLEKAEKVKSLIAALGE